MPEQVLHKQMHQTMFQMCATPAYSNARLMHAACMTRMHITTSQSEILKRHDDARTFIAVGIVVEGRLAVVQPPLFVLHFIRAL